MPDNVGPQRFKSASRKLINMKTRRTWKKISRVYIKKTRAEKRAIRDKNLVRRKDYAQALADARAVVRQQAEHLHEHYGGHSVQYYHQEIIQDSRITAASRKPSAWNAYLSSEIKRINEGTSACFLFSPRLTFFSILANPQNRRKANELAPEISARWKAMSEDEQGAIGEDLIPVIEEQREAKALARRNVPLETFGDASKTLQNIEAEVRLNLSPPVTL